MKIFASVAWKIIETIGIIKVESIILRLKESSIAHATKADDTPLCSSSNLDFWNNKNSSSNWKVKVSLTEASEDEVEEILAKAT